MIFVYIIFRRKANPTDYVVFSSGFCSLPRGRLRLEFRDVDLVLFYPVPQTSFFNTQ